MLKKSVCLALLFALVAMQLPIAALATSSTGASATSLRGTVQMRNGNGAWTVVSATVPVSAGTTLRTAANGEALIRLTSGAVVRLSPNSTATMSACAVNGPSPRLQMKLDGRAYALTHGVAATIATKNGVVTASNGEFLVDAASPGRTRLQVVSGSANLAGPAVHISGTPESASLTSMDGSRGVVLVAENSPVAANDQKPKGPEETSQAITTSQETALAIIGGAALIAIIAVLISNAAASK